MSIRVSAKASRGVLATAALLLAATALTGCTALGGRAFGDPMTTGSTATAAAGTLGQPMPPSLGAPPSSNMMAMGPFIPPADIGGGGMPSATMPMPMPSAPISSPIAAGGVTTGDLPVLSSTTTSLGNPVAMPATQTLAPATPAPVLMPQAAPVAPVVPAPSLATVPATGGTYVHVIQSGESLYTIARQYDVTTQALVQANGLSSPDKIFVGQKISIPGRPDLARTQAPQMAAVDDPQTSSPIVAPQPAAQSSAAIPNASVLVVPDTPAQATASAPAPAPIAPAPEPALSGNDKFAWPLSGKVIADFAASRQTGINIEIPEGTTVKAAENGTVIYVGSGVEGYGNLILIRHPNGYVSAYAHLQSMGVSKGQVVNRGDSIGKSGQTGSVTKPQLHFELRKGATPVDPMPLLG